MPEQLALLVVVGIGLILVGHGGEVQYECRIAPIVFVGWVVTEVVLMVVSAEVGSQPLEHASVDRECNMGEQVQVYFNEGLPLFLPHLRVAH